MENGTMIKLIPAVLALLGLLASAPLLTACHTTAGMGQDISNTGKAIENSAQQHTP
jgi:predicted small secreted protein